MKLFALPVLFVFILVLANCASTRPAARGISEFDGYVDNPLNRDNFVGIWQTTGDTQNYRLYEFRIDGTGSLNQYRNDQLERIMPFRYKTSDSWLIFFFTNTNFTNRADYTFSGSDSLFLQNWMISTTGDRNIIRIGDVPDDDIEAIAEVKPAKATNKKKKKAVQIEPMAGITFFPLYAMGVNLDMGDTPISNKEEEYDNYYVQADFNFIHYYQLSLKLFDRVGMALNLDIDDADFKKLSQLAGAIDAYRFGLRYDYHHVKGEAVWHGEPLGYRQIIPPSYDYEMHSRMITLFYRHTWDDGIHIDMGVWRLYVDGQKRPSYKELKIAADYTGKFEPPTGREDGTATGIYGNLNFHSSKETSYVWANLMLSLGIGGGAADGFSINGLANLGFALKIYKFYLHLGGEFRMHQEMVGLGPLIGISARF